MNLKGPKPKRFHDFKFYRNNVFIDLYAFNILLDIAFKGVR